ncbi:unnamed protein product [Lasius platythorax]|uniref:Uncharacterized protein n=1 Tax=Lasius platythorax TaxID=488582 RepID=A0AAV2NBM0_9HYME
MTGAPGREIPVGGGAAVKILVTPRDPGDDASGGIEEADNAFTVPPAASREWGTYEIPNLKATPFLSSLMRWGAQLPWVSRVNRTGEM